MFKKLFIIITASFFAFISAGCEKNSEINSPEEPQVKENIPVPVKNKNPEYGIKKYGVVKPNSVHKIRMNKEQGREKYGIYRPDNIQPQKHETTEVDKYAVYRPENIQN